MEQIKKAIELLEAEGHAVPEELTTRARERRHAINIALGAGNDYWERQAALMRALEPLEEHGYKVKHAWRAVEIVYPPKQEEPDEVFGEFVKPKSVADVTKELVKPAHTWTRASYENSKVFVPAERFGSHMQYLIHRDIKTLEGLGYEVHYEHNMRGSHTGYTITGKRTINPTDDIRVAVKRALNLREAEGDFLNHGTITDNKISFDSRESAAATQTARSHSQALRRKGWVVYNLEAFTYQTVTFQAPAEALKAA